MRDIRQGKAGGYLPGPVRGLKGPRPKPVYRPYTPYRPNVYGQATSIPVVHGSAPARVNRPVKPEAQRNTTTPPHTNGPVRSVAPPRPQRHVPVGVSNLPRQKTSRPPAARPRRAQGRVRQPVAAPPQTVNPEQQFIDASVNPQLQALDRLSQFQAQQQQQAVDTFHQNGQQFLDAIQQVPGQIQADYERGIAQQAGLAKLSADALLAANPNGQAQADLAAIGAPQSQRDAIAQVNQTVFGGGAAGLQYTGGTLPATQMSQDEAARLAYARELPAIAKASGDKVLSEFLRAQASKAFDIQNQRAGVLSQVPKLRMDYQSQQASNAAKQQQLNLERAALGLKAQNQTFQQGATKIKLTQAQQRQQTGNAFRFAEIYGYDPATGKPTLAAVKAAKADARKARKPPSTAALKNWNLFAEDAYHGVAPKTRYDSKSAQFIPVPGTGKAPLPYYPALKKLLAMGATLAQAQKVLNALYAKGEGGRPYVSLQGRIALQKAGTPLSGTNSVPTQAQIDFLRQQGLWSD